MPPGVVGDQTARKRFLREARAMAAIHHERVAMVFQVGAGKTGGAATDMPFLAMQYLPGETMHARLARERSIPAGQVARIGRETAEGLAAAHAQGLIHRDIKPSNIWLAHPNDSVKI